METTINLNLLGKEFLNEKEAAHYCCVSLSHFRAKQKEYGIAPSSFMGKRIYRRDDLKRALENQWQHYKNMANTGQ